MEKKTIGTFLSALRKANGMTQQEVADKLNISNKTVSKWERDEGCPEIMMLPAIAELYSVTVDEILRGERITKEIHEEYKSTKSEERIKFLVGKASTRFTNNSIISIILGIVALILSYTICDIVYDYNVLWIGYVIILLLVAGSVAALLISFNNLVSGLNNGENIEKTVFESTMKNCIKHITVVTALTLIALLGVVLNIVMNGPSFLFVALPATALVGCVVAYFVRSFLYKKYNIQEQELSLEQKKYRKKHIKITSIILSVVILVSILSPFIGVVFEHTLSSSAFSYTDAVGYQYDTLEEAKTEYYKIKGVVVDNKEIYNLIDEEYIEDNDTYILYLQELWYVFEETENGYQLDYVGALVNNQEIQMFFNSYDEMEKFKSDSVYNYDGVDLGMLHKNVTFDDEALTIRYKSNTNYLHLAFDILPVFIIIGSCVCIIIFVVSVIIYYKKKKALAENH